MSTIYGWFCEKVTRCCIKQVMSHTFQCIFPITFHIAKKKAILGSEIGLLLRISKSALIPQPGFAGMWLSPEENSTKKNPRFADFTEGFHTSLHPIIWVLCNVWIGFYNSLPLSATGTNTSVSTMLPLVALSGSTPGATKNTIAQMNTKDEPYQKTSQWKQNSSGRTAQLTSVTLSTTEPAERLKVSPPLPPSRWLMVRVPSGLCLPGAEYELQGLLGNMLPWFVKKIKHLQQLNGLH